MKYTRWYVGDREPEAAVHRAGWVERRYETVTECEVAVAAHNEPLDALDAATMKLARIERQVDYYLRDHTLGLRINAILNGVEL